MLNRVKIQNFKSIGEPGVDLELKPLTFLVGPNGGGKSSILDAIGFAAQESLTGQSANLPSWTSVKHNLGGRNPIIETTFTEVAGNGKSLGSVFRPRIVSDSDISLSTTFLLDGRAISTSSEVVGAVRNLLSKRFRPNTFLISSIRGNVPYTVTTGSNPAWVGTHGENLISVLAMLFGQRQNEKIALAIAEWASRFGFHGLNAGFWGGNNLGSDYLDSELKSALNLALSSSGAKQILTVITQLFWAPRGSLLMIEEPEISLHPAAQIDVMEMFADALNDDKQIIATTHGLFMLQALGYAVQQDWLKSDQIAVHHVEKKESGTTTKQLPLNKEGFIEGWIPSFAEVERRLMREWIKTLPEE